MPDMSEPGNGNGDNGRKARVTIRQIADLAGVSIATVSRVVNGRGDVSDETRELVQRVVREHGYSVNRTARGLSAGRTGFVGVTVPKVAPVFFSSILSGAAEALYEQDMRIVLRRAQHDPHVLLVESLGGAGEDGREEDRGDLRHGDTDEAGPAGREPAGAAIHRVPVLAHDALDELAGLVGDVSTAVDHARDGGDRDARQIGDLANRHACLAAVVAVAVAGLAHVRHLSSFRNVWEAFGGVSWGGGRPRGSQNRR